MFLVFFRLVSGYKKVNKDRPTNTRKVPTKQPFPSICPTDSLFVGHSVINTHPPQNSSEESPPKVPKLKTSFESTRRAINILKSVNSFRSPES